MQREREGGKKRRSGGDARPGEAQAVSSNKSRAGCRMASGAGIEVRLDQQRRISKTWNLLAGHAASLLRGHASAQRQYGRVGALRFHVVP